MIILHDILEKAINATPGLSTFRLRSNSNIFQLPGPHPRKGPGRPRKYSKKFGNASSVAARFRPLANEYDVNFYGRIRAVAAYERVVMFKTQSRYPHAVMNHLHFCMMAMSIPDSLTGQQFLDFQYAVLGVLGIGVGPDPGSPEASYRSTAHHGLEPVPQTRRF